MVWEAENPVKPSSPEVEGLVTDTRSLRWFAEEAQTTYIAEFSDRWAENIHAQIAVVKKIESVVVTKFKTPEGERTTRTIVFEGGFPSTEIRIHLFVGKLQQVIDKAGQNNLLSYFFGGS